jgi:hypothetical protein
MNYLSQAPRKMQKKRIYITNYGLTTEITSKIIKVSFERKLRATLEVPL